MSMTAERVGFPEEVWLGMMSGEWPVRAFPKEYMARSWAAGSSTHSGVRYVIGPISVDPALAAYRAVTIPATTVWEKGDA